LCAQRVRFLSTGSAAMLEMSRSQVIVYAAVAAALLLVGARAIRGEGATEASFAATSGGGGGGGSFSIGRSGGEVVVDVTGAVRDPGVYRMPAGSRVNDAVTRAGGAAPGALLEAINLASRLADGQQVVVPKRLPGGGTVAAAGAEEGPISLGTATAEQLEEIEGIGPVTAGDIIEFRDEHGGLSSVDQLDQVPGIGPATMESLRARLQP
jgi:competence protein ComEA